MSVAPVTPCGLTAQTSRTDLESVLLTVELTRRPSHPPDHAAENRALVAVAQALSSAEDILQKLVDAAITLCGAHSAGISLLHEDGQSFDWPAITGRWAATWEAPCHASSAHAARCSTVTLRCSFASRTSFPLSSFNSASDRRGTINSF